MDAFNAFSSYVANSNECIQFKLVKSADDLIEDFKENGIENAEVQNGSIENDKNLFSFKPLMSYQFFGDNENIFGYRNLTVKIYYSCAHLNIYLGLKYDDKLNKQYTNGVEPDDIVKIISTKYETKICYNLNEFSKNLWKEKSFKPYGDLIKNFTIECLPEKAGYPTVNRKFCIFKANESVPGFVPYHERMQTFLMWFIENISYIEIEDNKWEIFVLYETVSQDESASTDVQYYFVGYATVYRYFYFPDKIRPRISQFIILPPFQRINLGSKLFETIFENYNNESVIDITVEQPSEEFQRMRDIICCKLCMKLESFSIENLKKGWSEAMSQEARSKLKLHPKQTRRFYEILKLWKFAQHNTVALEEFESEIKRRLNLPQQKQLNYLEKLLKKKVITEEKYHSLIRENLVPEEYNAQHLDKKFSEIKEEYLEIIEKLK